MNLQQLAQQVERQKKLLAVQEDLIAQTGALEEKAAQCRGEWEKEQADVARLDRLSLTSLLHELMGDKEEKMEQEQREAMAAAAKYQGAKAELERVRQELQHLRGELAVLEGCQERYRLACNDRAEMLKASGSETGKQILALEEQEAAVCAQLRELREAISAGEAAWEEVANVAASLDSAEGWGIYDIWGGGLLADVVKHGHLDDAQAAMSRLQEKLRSYKTELVDVRLEADLQLHASEFLHFADWFFDGIFADWAMQDKINDAQDRTAQVRMQIGDIQSRLHAMEADYQDQQQSIQAQIDKLVIG